MISYQQFDVCRRTLNKVAANPSLQAYLTYSGTATEKELTTTVLLTILA